jgi:hypothetical protein
VEETKQYEIDRAQKWVENFKNIQKTILEGANIDINIFAKEVKKTEIKEDQVHSPLSNF